MSNRDREPSQTWRESNDSQRAAQDQASGVEHGYGQGGRTAFGQMVDGGSDMAGRGFGGSNAGGFGQQTQNSQWGQGGMGPMTQGANYSQGGGQFGPTGYQPLPENSGPESSRQGARGQQASHAPADLDRQRGGTGQTPYASSAHDDYGQTHPNATSHGQGRDPFAQSSAGQYGQSQGAAHHDDHEPHYRTWRENQLASHDRDYARWREEQVRKYDEDYKGWRNERHSTFSKAFEGWRSGRGGQAGAATAGAATAGAATSGPGYASRSDDGGRPADPNAIHGANPTLASIADGGTGRPEDRSTADKREAAEPETETHKA